MKVFLGLGSNLGDRRDNLVRALAGLEARGLSHRRVSPVVETPALLPPAAPSNWNRPYLNVVVEGGVEGSPDGWLSNAKTIEAELGPRSPERWAPRAIDIDILLWGEETIRSEALAVPHRELARRSFVLTPLAHLEPSLRVPGQEATVLELSRRARPRTPLWMGIINVTPDSFSDGGQHLSWPAIEAAVDEMVAAGVHIVDVGAESTRPGADEVPPSEEWARLEPVLNALLDKWRGDPLRPRLSVDTRRSEVAERALELGADWINDVSGLAEPAMLALARKSTSDWIAMHQLSLPVEIKIRLPDDSDPVSEVETWLESQLRLWEKEGIDLDRILFDPGIGFGKNALQSLELLRSIERFQRYGLRILVGHSRKSFMKTFSAETAADRDLESIGAALALCDKGVEVLRVHNVADHLRAYAGWAHILS